MSDHFLTTYPWYKPAGLAPRLLRAGRALAAAGHTVDWVAVDPPSIKDEGIVFHILGASDAMKHRMPDHRSRFPWAFYMWHGGGKCRELATRDETRALFAFSYGASFPLLCAARTTRKPLVIFLRSNEQQENNIKGVSLAMKWLFKTLEKRAVRSATKIVPITQELADVMTARHGEGVRAKCEILHNDLPSPPQDIEACRKTVRDLVGHPEAFVITSNGPFNERKNFGVLIEAFGQMQEERARLLLVGDGPLRSAQEDMVSRMGLADRICFTGWRDDAAQLTAGSDLFVLPSQAEGVSNSLLEALTANVPCLVSSIPEHTEIFPDTEIHFQHSSVEQLSAKLERAMSDPVYSRKIRETCRHGAEKLRFDWNSRVVNIMNSLTTEE